MARQDYCDITIVLDRSGSMASVKKDTEGGFNQFIEEQRKLPGKCLLTLVQFDTEYEFVSRGTPVAMIGPLTLVPRGGTALLDAIGRAISETGERLKVLAEDERPAKVLFVIITDGEENSSKEFSRERIFQSIKHQRDVYKWEFVFLGANQDAIQTGASVGIPISGSLTYAANSVGTLAAFSSVTRNTTSYRSGATNTMGFTKQDRDDQDDALKSGGL